MAKLIYTAITSLDGYIEDEDAELPGRSGPSGLTRGGSAQAARGRTARDVESTANRPS